MRSHAAVTVLGLLLAVAGCDSRGGGRRGGEAAGGGGGGGGRFDAAAPGADSGGGGPLDAAGGGEGGATDGGASDGDVPSGEDSGGRDARLPDGMVCFPGEPMCLSHSELVVCSDDGSGWEPMEQCPRGQVCDGEVLACVPQVCRAGDNRCAEGELSRTHRQFCNRWGSAWEEPVPCRENFVCREGSCAERVCVPGVQTCEDEFNLKICDGLGTGWVVESCRQGKACSERTGACEDQICVPGSTSCSDDRRYLVRCDRRGLELEQTRCQPDEECVVRNLDGETRALCTR